MQVICILFVCLVLPSLSLYQRETNCFVPVKYKNINCKLRTVNTKLFTNLFKFELNYLFFFNLFFSPHIRLQVSYPSLFHINTNDGLL